jgi:hypothetical protein
MFQDQQTNWTVPSEKWGLRRTTYLQSKDFISGCPPNPAQKTKRKEKFDMYRTRMNYAIQNLVVDSVTQHPAAVTTVTLAHRGILSEFERVSIIR